MTLLQSHSVPGIHAPAEHAKSAWVDLQIKQLTATILTYTNTAAAP
jgi:hypothetical protein